MTLEILLRYIHFISIFLIVSTLACEHLLLRKELKRSEIVRLSKIDGLYGVAALTLVGAGLTLWLGGIGKPAVYYSKNWIFLTKLSFFTVIGLLSVYPTIFFIKNRKGDLNDLVQVPRSIFWMVRTELLMLLIVPFLASLMAKGIGFFGS